MTDRTPDGKEIKTATMWLSFAEGDYPFTLDFTEFHHNLKQAQATAERISALLEARERRRQIIQESLDAFFDFEDAMENVKRLCSQTPEEIAEMSERIKELGQ